MANYVTSDTTLTAVANAIRSRTGKSAQIEYADGFVTEINGMIGKDYLDGHLVDAVASAPIASFPDGANGQPMLVTASITPVQDLSGGEPSPSHICPIYGWTGAEVTGAGVNLCNASVGRNEGKLRGDDGTESSTSSSGYTAPMDGFLPNTNYTISGQIQTANGAGRIYFLDSNGDWISRTTSFGLSEMPYTFKTPANCRYIEIQYNNAYTALTGVQIELGSTASSYSAYSGTTLSVTFPNPPGTVYGGSLTINRDGSGVLTVDMEMSLFDGVNKKVSSTGTSGVTGKIYGFVNVSGAVQDNDAIRCNMLYNKNGTIAEIGTIYQISSGNGIVIVLPDQTLDTKEKMNEWLQSNNLQVCYSLATPVTYTLTSQQVGQLMSKLGVNHVWANTGNCAVEYSPDTDLWIQKVLAGESA